MTIDQIREAIANSDTGGFLQQIFRISDRTESTARGTPRPAVAETPAPLDLESLSASTALEIVQRAAIPASVPAGPQESATAGDARLLTLRVGLTPSPTSTFLVTDELLTDESVEDPWKEAFSGGWDDIFLKLNSRPLFPDYSFDLNALDTVVSSSGAAALPSDSANAYHPRIDTLVLSGDFSAGYALSALGADIGQVELIAGNDYVVAVNDDFVASGRWLLVHGEAADSLMFDGSAETDGRFFIKGSGAGDFIFGGGGADLISGLGGADVLSGGAGGDIFSYYAAGDSTGANYDIIADFDAADRIDLRGKAPSFGTAIDGGALSEASFDADLGAALSGLGPNQARWFAPNSGDLAGTIFLIVDGNGVAGYQSGQDYVIAIGGASLADLTAQPAIFI